MIFFPMEKEEVLANGWRWKDDMPGTRGKETRTEIPDSIHDTPDDIINDILACETCGKNYKIIKQEYAFYKQCVIPIPRTCFDCRFASRIAQRNHTQLYHRQCMCEKTEHDHSGKCPTTFETTYSPDRLELVYCEQCYRKEVV